MADVALVPGWLDLVPVPDITVAHWDAGEPVPPQEVLDRVVFFVPPYMGALADVALAQRMPRLQVVQALMAGVDGMAEVLPSGVELRRAVGVHDASTAELAVGLMIAAQRGLDIAARNMSEGHWDHRRLRSLADSRVAIVGWGGVGRAIAARLAPFECEVTAFSRSGTDGALPVESLTRRWDQFDIVVLALPLTPETTPFLTADRLAALAPGTLVVNVGRGGLVDTQALVAEVQSGRLRAAVDVTDPEPLPAEHPLWRAPGVLVTPHVGGNSAAFPPRATGMVQRELAAFAASRAAGG